MGKDCVKGQAVISKEPRNKKSCNGIYMMHLFHDIYVALMSNFTLVISHCVIWKFIVYIFMHNAVVSYVC